MTLIPPDIGVRLRMETEASLQSIAPIKGIPSDLPELQVGQAFSARIQQVLPENTYRALVAGKTVTLALPQGASPGDTLDLVVIDRTAKAIVAQIVSGKVEAATAPYANTNLSPAAQLIGKLLLPEGQAPAAAPLSRGQPLLAQPPLNGADMAPKLSQAVTQSGLFYESHQAKWVAGQLTMAQLQQEPQGQHPIALAIRHFAAATPPGLPQFAEPNALSQTPTRANLSPETIVKTEILAKAESALLPKELAQALSSANTKPGNYAIDDSLRSLQTPFPLRTESSPQTASTAAPAQQIPDDLRPLVQQQLDSVATQRLAWHGEVWPGQKMDWQIEWEKENSRDDAETSQEKWNTTLRLTTPRLGKVDATVSLAGNSIRINLATPYGASAADLRNGSPALASALEAAGLQVIGLQVKHEEE